MEKIVIETTNLTKDYGQQRGIFNLNLQVRAGEVYGFIGTNGSGKTTTVRNMMGFIQPDGGKSTILGLDSWKHSAKIMDFVSYVPGEIAFPALKTGTEFLKSQADYLGVKDFTYMNHVIELLQLDPSANLKRMSKGMKQKTALVAALMGEKPILVLDEPTTGLDPLMREAFLELIREEKAKGHTIFMSTHIFEEVEEVCDRVSMILDGHLMTTLSLYDLRHPQTKHFTLEFATPSALEKFKQSWGPSLIKTSETIGEITLPLGKMDTLIRRVKDYPLINFEEHHLTLQEQFTKVYQEEGTHHGRK